MIKNKCLVILTSVLILSLIVTKSECQQTIQVLTFNIRLDTDGDKENAWTHRKELVVNEITQISPDFIGLQEVLPHQMQYIEKNLTGYKVIYRTREVKESEGEGTPVLVNLNKWDVLEEGTFWLSGTPDIPGSNTWNAAYKRIATWVKVLSKDTGDEILFLNTHYDNVSDSARLKSSKLICKKVKELANGMPYIVTGDLNVDDKNLAYTTLLECAKLTDSYLDVYPTLSSKDYTFNNWKPGDGEIRIDYILVSKDLKPIKAKVLKNKPGEPLASDHYAVFVSLGKNE